MPQLLQNLKYAVRGLRRAPTFTAVTLLTLALGVGANAAIYSVVHAVLLQKLPYRDPSRLVAVGHRHAERGTVFGAFSPQDYDDLRAGVPDFEALAAWWFVPGNGGRNLTGAGDPVHLEAAMVSGDLFTTLGVPAALGRTFSPAEDTPGGNRVAVLSDRFWRTRFGSDSTIIGSTVRLDGDPYLVLGVMPPAFTFPSAEADAWLPLSLIDNNAVPHVRGVRWMQVVGRLAPGVSREAATARASDLIGRLAQTYPQSNEGWVGAVLDPLQHQVVGEVGPALLALLAAVGLVLLIACVNVAHLLLVRGAGRTHELAVRAALGASRGRLAGQFLTESALLVTVGGVFGLGLAAWAVPLLVRLAGDALPRASEVGINLNVVGFTLAVTAVAFLLVGVAPSFRAARWVANPVLRGGKRISGGGGSSHGGWLLGAESGLAVLLLTGTALALTSLWRLTHVDPGLEADHVVSFRLLLSNIPPTSTGEDFRLGLLDRLEQIPGVVSAGGSKQLPLTGGGEQYTFVVTRADARADTVSPAAGFLIVTPGYFESLGIPLLEGRAFTPADSAVPTSMVVNRALARSVWPGADAVGQRFGIGPYTGVVVGVVGDVHQLGLAKPVAPAAYVPSALFPRGTLNVFVRTQGSPLALLAPIRAAVREFAPDLAITDLGPLGQQLGATLARPRLLASLVAMFGGLALVLAAVGVYGVVATGVARRRQEMGIRLALGALAGDVISLVLRSAMGWALAGAVAGVAGFLAVSTLLRGFVYGVSPTNPGLLAAGAAGLLLIAAIAAWIPARLASRVDPVTVLRSE